MLGVEGLMLILEPLKNQYESWKSPGNLLLKKGTNPVYDTANKGNEITISSLAKVSAAALVRSVSSLRLIRINAASVLVVSSVL